MAVRYKSFSAGAVLATSGDKQFMYEIPSNCVQAKITFLSTTSTTNGQFFIKKSGTNYYVGLPPVSSLCIAASDSLPSGNISGQAAANVSKLGIYLDAGDAIYCSSSTTTEISLFVSGLLEYND